MPLRQPCYGFPCIVRDLACKQGWVGGGGAEHHCEGGEGRTEVPVRTKKVMDDVELGPRFFDQKYLAGNLTCGPLHSFSPNCKRQLFVVFCYCVLT